MAVVAAVYDRQLERRLPAGRAGGMPVKQRGKESDAFQTP